MKIGLIHPFYDYEENKENRPFPFGIAYIANFLIQNGHKAEILDLNANYMKMPQIIDAIKKMNVDIVGISGLSGGFTYVKGLTTIIKENFDIPIIVGGPLGTHNAETVLMHTKADACVVGQGEYIVLDLLNNLNNPEVVKGIVYRDNKDNIVRNQEAIIKDLDNIPWPAYQIMNMEDYIWSGASADMDSRRRYMKGLRVMQMITGRGCPMGCRFCSKVMGRMAVLRSVDKVIEEIKFLIKKYQINGISFRDELYLMNRGHVHRLSAELKKLGIIWMGQGRVDKVDLELLKHMKKCGCISIGFGIESGSPKMLKLMNKGQTVEQAKKAMKICQKVDMDVKVQLVMGYPGENRQTVEETVSFFKEVGNPGRRFHLITPLPGSELYADLINKGAIKDEASYLTELSKRESGFSKGLPLLNLTEFSDEELLKLKLEAERRMQENYKRYIRKHPVEIYRYLRDKLVYQKLLFQPMVLLQKIMIRIGIVDYKKLEKQQKTYNKQKTIEFQAL